ncbi:MAG: DUF2207 domain-containing protein, partial [Sphingomonadaceae bacterium]|nr:DUF2207 domain-containing protein [Sphingomonadaceae bacterium]
MRPRLLAALLIAAFALIAPAAAQKPGADDWGGDPSLHQGERIVSYYSDIQVAADASLHVTETIRVEAEGERIRHGIFRDFPTAYTRDHRTVRVGFSVESVERDGHNEHWSRESIDGGVRVRIGDADNEVPPGQHTYVIRYTTTRQLNFSNPNFDELYWNVTGNYWEFPIETAEARVRLPQAAQFGETSLYTGRIGEEGNDAQVVAQTPGEIDIRTTRPLDVHEGLTISVTWPKGVIAAPPPPSALVRWMLDYGPIAAGIVALLSLAGFYFYAWLKAGRGPLAGTVVPLFQPPEGMSAAAVRFVKRMGFDNRCYAAAIVESGVRRKIRLVDHEEGLIFKSKKTRIEKTADPDDMPDPERDMLRALFGSGDSVEIDRKNYQVFGAAKKALQGGLTEAYKGSLFLTNLGWAWAGLALMLAMVALVGATLLSADPFGGADEAPAAWLCVGLFLVALGAAPRSRRSGTWGWVALGVSIVAGVLGALMLFGLLAFASDAGLLLPVLSPLLALPLVISAFWWMAAPTREGRKMMDEIAGFQRYLSVTEENRLEVLHPPEKTPELFERFLPYAIALGVENKWADRFASVLAAAAADPDRQQGQYMGWYVGSGTAPWSNPGRF